MYFKNKFECTHVLEYTPFCSYHVIVKRKLCGNFWPNHKNRDGQKKKNLRELVPLKLSKSALRPLRMESDLLDSLTVSRTLCKMICRHYMEF